MRHFRSFIAMAALILVVTAASTLPAQPWGRFGHGPSLRSGHGLRGVGGYYGGNYGYTSLFDLYRLDKIPLPPYYSLHPPVYYDRINYTAYGATPFAFPHNWWTQYAYPVSALGTPYAAPHGIAAPVPPPPPEPKMIENPYVTEDQAAAPQPGPGDVTNPYAAANGPAAKAPETGRVAVIENPFVSKRSGAGKESDPKSVRASLTIRPTGTQEAVNPFALANRDGARLGPPTQR